MSVRRDCRDLSVRSNGRNVSKEGLHGCQLGEIAGRSE